jgi:hypothetical protein
MLGTTDRQGLWLAFPATSSPAPAHPSPLAPSRLPANNPPSDTLCLYLLLACALVCAGTRGQAIFDFQMAPPTQVFFLTHRWAPCQRSLL